MIIQKFLKSLIMPRQAIKRTAAGKAKAAAPAKRQKLEDKKLKKEDDAKTTETKTTETKATPSKTTGKKLHEYLTDAGWRELLKNEFEKSYFKEMDDYLCKESKTKTIFPPRDLIFNAFNLTPIEEIKLVILGQDPYHDDGQAMGMAFSVPEGIKVPPSLRNIYKELEQDIPGFKTPNHGNLQKWAERGIFMLNTVLTVEAHKANSHAKIGWKSFTDAVLTAISKNCDKVVFILWGIPAQKKSQFINRSKHIIIQAAHPSPLSFSKFTGCKCFSKANKALEDHGKTVIDWSLS